MNKKEILIVLGAIIGLFAFLIGCINLDKLQCHKTAEIMGVNCSYSFLTGCVIDIKGKKIPLKNYRGLED